MINQTWVPCENHGRDVLLAFVDRKLRLSLLVQNLAHHFFDLIVSKGPGSDAN